MRALSPPGAAADCTAGPARRPAMYIVYYAVGRVVPPGCFRTDADAAGAGTADRRTGEPVDGAGMDRRRICGQTAD